MEDKKKSADHPPDSQASMASKWRVPLGINDDRHKGVEERRRLGLPHNLLF